MPRSPTESGRRCLSPCCPGESAARACDTRGEASRARRSSSLEAFRSSRPSRLFPCARSRRVRVGSRGETSRSDVLLLFGGLRRRRDTCRAALLVGGRSFVARQFGGVEPRVVPGRAQRANPTGGG